MEFFQNFAGNQWLTLAFAAVALIVWTIGNVLKRKLFVYIGVALCVLAVLAYLKVFNFLFPA